MSNPAKIMIGAIAAIDTEPDYLHRKTMIDAVEDEWRNRFGCRCERNMRAAVCLPNDAGEAARMLLRRLMDDVTLLVEYRGPRDGMAEGMAVAAERLQRLAGMSDEFDSD